MFHFRKMKKFIRSDEQVFEAAKQWDALIDKYSFEQTDADAMDWEDAFVDEDTPPEFLSNMETIKEAVVDKTGDDILYLNTEEMMKQPSEKQKLEICRVVPRKWIENIVTAYQERMQEVAQLNLPYWSYEEKWETKESIEEKKVVFKQDSVTFSATRTKKAQCHSKKLSVGHGGASRDRFDMNKLLNGNVDTVQIRPTISDYFQRNVQANNQSIHLNFVFHQPCGAEFLESLHEMCGNSLTDDSFKSIMTNTPRSKKPTKAIEDVRPSFKKPVAKVLDTIYLADDKGQLTDRSAKIIDKETKINKVGDSSSNKISIIDVDDDSDIECIQSHEADEAETGNINCYRNAELSTLGESQIEVESISSDEDVLNYPPNYIKKLKANQSVNKRTNLTLPLEQCEITSKKIEKTKTVALDVTSNEELARKRFKDLFSSDSE